MDSEIIYVKTAFGEEAMQQRTRVMQRNVRMVLILVDGQSTVADLSLKTGNPELTENALRELEKGGFIEPAAEVDSLWAESKRVAQEIRSAAVDKVSQLAPSRGKEPSLGAASAVPPHANSPDSGLSQFSLGRFQASELPGMKSVEPGSAGRRHDSPTTPRVKEVETAKAEKPVAIKPIRRGRRRGPGWPVLAVLVLIGVLFIAGLSVVFFPYQRYLPELQLAMSELCGLPVSVGELRVDVYPKAGVLLGNVSIGSGEEALRIDQVRLQPEVASLMAPKKQFQEVVLRGVVFSAGTVATLQDVLAALARPGAAAGVKHVGLEDVGVGFAGLGLDALEGEAGLSADGALRSLSLHSADRSLTVAAVPHGSGVDLALEGFGWRSSKESPWHLDSLNIKGRVEGDALTLDNVDVRLFDGSVRGKIVLRADPKPAMTSDLEFERINSTALGEALGIGRQLSGEVAGSVRVAASADAWPSIFSTLSADGQFSMQRGSVQGIDLAEAMRRVSNNPVQGGATQFEQLSGKIRVSPKNYRFSDLNLVSGLMQSTGRIDVDKDLRIAGVMELRMRGSVNQTRVPVSLDGTLKSPELQRGKGD